MRGASAIAAIIVGLGVAGCFDYRTACKPGELLDGDRCRPVDACQPNELPLVGGGCEPIGVRDCGRMGIEAGGGCEPFVPPESCTFGSFYLSMSASCDPLRACQDDTWQAEDLASFDRRVHVDPAFAGEADGSPRKPYPSIAAALDAPGEGSLTILLAAGTHRASAPIRHKVQIVGRCAAETILEPEVANEPALTFLAGSEGSFVHDLAVSGGELGAQTAILVRAGGVRFEQLHAYGFEGPALAFDDAMVPSEIASSLFEDVQTGIEVRGSSVTVSESELRHIGGMAIRAHPSRHAGASEELAWDPRTSEPSVVEVQTVIVDGAVGAGILIEGSVGKVSDSLIRNVAPDDENELARGIIATWRPTGAIHTDLAVERSALFGPLDVGVDAWNARVALDHVHLDGQGAEVDSTAACASNAGAGARIRNDEALADGPSGPSTIRNVLVEGFGRSGVRLEGATATVERAIVRDIGQGCGIEVGDGVSVESYRDACDACSGFPEAALTLASSRIERGGRSGMVVFGDATLTARDALLECNASDVVAPGAPELGRSVCRCSDAPSLCSPSDAPLQSPVAGRSPCSSDDGHVCAGWKYGPAKTVDVPIEGGTVHVLAPDGVLPLLTDSDGAVELDGVHGPAQRVLQLATKPGFVARSHAFVTGPEDQKLGWYANLPAFDLLRSITAQGFDQAILDLSLGIVQIQVCYRPGPLPSDPPETIPDGYCGAGIEGTTVALEPLSRGPSDRSVTLYWVPGSDAPVPSLRAAVGHYMAVAGVRRGYRTLRIRLPPGPELACSSDLGGGWLAGWELEQDPADWRTVLVRIPVEEARLSAGTHVMCTERG